ncbi:MAG: sporulation integral membrane protein YtvI [Clostridia bacterium]|nr:sporulation integral membrane protein YtvI [Clostridia bacterium]
MPDESARKRFAVTLTYAAAVAAALYIVFHYLWGALLPFVIGYALAECFKPVVRYAEKHEKFPKRTLILLILALAAGAAAALVFAALRELFRELYGLAGTVTEAVTRIRDDDSYAAEIIEDICRALPFSGLEEKLWEIRPAIDEYLLSALAGYADDIAGAAISFAGNAFLFLPEALFAFAVTLISAYYFAVDRVRVNCFFLGLFPKQVRPALKRAKDGLTDGVVKYVRAYAIIFIMTFAQLFAAFLLMGQKYAFIASLAIALVDILPVVGTGTVLIPWGAAALAFGNYGTGIALLATYAVITVVRQIAEPKIVGKFIGLPPLAALAAMYAGLKLMGLPGLIIFPLAALAIYRYRKEKSAA